MRTSQNIFRSKPLIFAVLILFAALLGADSVSQVGDRNNHRVQKFRMVTASNQPARITYAPLQAVPPGSNLGPGPGSFASPRMNMREEISEAPNRPESEK